MVFPMIMGSFIGAFASKTYCLPSFILAIAFKNTLVVPRYYPGQPYRFPAVVSGQNVPFLFILKQHFSGLIHIQSWFVQHQGFFYD